MNPERDAHVPGYETVLCTYEDENENGNGNEDELKIENLRLKSGTNIYNPNIYCFVLRRHHWP